MFFIGYFRVNNTARTIYVLYVCIGQRRLVKIGFYALFVSPYGEHLYKPKPLKKVTSMKIIDNPKVSPI